MSDQPSLKFVYSVLIFIQVIFGINFVASKIVVSYLSPVFWAQMRFLVAGLLLFIFALVKHRQHFFFSKKYFIQAFFLALSGITISQISFMVGIKYTTSINTSIICSMIPVFTLLVVTLKGQEKLNFSKIFGFILSFLGVLVIRKAEAFSLSNSTFVGDLFILLSAFSTAIFLSYSKKFFQSHNHVWATTWLFLIGGVQITLATFFEKSIFAGGTFTFELPLILSMLFSVIGATLLTYFLNNWALIHVESGKLSLFIYLQPVVASGFAFIFLGEIINLRIILSCLLIVLGFMFALGDRFFSQKLSRKISPVEIQ